MSAVRLSLLAQVCASLLWTTGVALSDLRQRQRRRTEPPPHGPVIGILAAPEFKPAASQYKRSYIAASYVKWLEAEGARVVPLMYDAAPPELDALLSRVNGLLFPGGAYPMEPVYEAFSKLVFKRAVQDKIPTWGTCLGQLQLLLYSSGRNAPGPISGGWDGMGPLMLPINLTAAGQHWQPIAELSEVTRHGIGHQQWAFHSHNWSVSVADFEQSPELNSTWEVLAADADRTGRTFVSLVRGRQLPFIGSIFHPEKAAYEYQLPKPAGDFRGSLPVHSAGAIDVMSHLGKFFVSTCRAFRSFAFSREEILRWNIHNWSPRYAAPLDSVFEEIYYFPAGGVPPPPEIAGASQALKPW